MQVSILGRLDKNVNFSLKKKFKESFINDIRRYREVQGDEISIELRLLRVGFERR